MGKEPTYKLHDDDGVLPDTVVRLRDLGEPLDDSLLDAIEALELDHSITFGGGASPQFTITKITDWRRD